LEAVMYLTLFSTPEQADPLNLKNQEDGWSQTGDQRGIAVAEVILGRESLAALRTGTSLCDCFSYCKAHRKGSAM